MIKNVLLLFLTLPLLCAATDLKPWFGNEYEFEFRASFLYQNFNSLSTASHHRFKHTENDGFLTLSIAYPFKHYCGEFEATVADTRVQNYRWDNFRLTMRHQLLSEDEGDIITLTTGLTLTEPFSLALHDLSSFHHGHFEAEATVSLGQEFGFPDYICRWWNVVGIGTAEEGSPWIREDAACEYKYEDRHLFRGFMNTLWGTGHKGLHPYKFKGYGSIRHQSVDLGVRYGYVLGCYGTLSIAYARRVFAYNFPRNTNLVLLEYYLPFGMQVFTNY